MKKILLVLVLAANVFWQQGVSSGQSNNSPLRARELFYMPPPEEVTLRPQTPVVGPPTAPIVMPATKAPKQMTKQVPAKQPPTMQASPDMPAKPEMETVSERPASAVPLGLRYTVLKRNGAGKFEEVNADNAFHSGDRIRIEARANTTGYLYVVAQGSSGNWQVLFPTREVAGGSNQVHRNETRQIPSGDRGQFLFDEQAGAEKIFLVLTRQPEASLDKLIYAIGAPATPATPEAAHLVIAQTSVSDDVISRIRSQMASRDLIFEKVEKETVAQQANGQNIVETANYVVDPSTAPDARLVVDVKLKHQ